jgi:hypothetical protein
MKPRVPSFGIRHEQHEAVRAAHDTFHYDCRPGESITPFHFLEWAGEINARRLKDDGKVFVYLGPDGSVHGVTERFESQGDAPKAVVIKHNHHDPLDPPDTPSSTMQLLHDLEAGRFVSPVHAGVPHVFHTYLDNHDQDVCSYIWLMENWRRIVTNPKLYGRMQNFLRLQDILDVNAGLVPVAFSATDGPEKAHADLVRQNMWVFKPYDDAPKGDDLGAEQMMGVIREVGMRLDAFARGEAQMAEVDTRVTMIARGDGWCMFDGDKSGQQARFELCKDYRVVIRASITKNGTYHYGYSIGQVSDQFLPASRFPRHTDLTALCAHLNKIEGISEDEEDKWGGRKNVIGPPKIRKSALPQDRLIEEFLKFYA